MLDRVPEKAPELENLGKNLLAARKRAGLTQRQLALRAGVNTATINRIERSLRRPTLEQLAQLARVLQVSWQWFFGASNWPGPTLEEIAIELQSLGMVDLLVPGVKAPGAFRPPEEVVALALSGNDPEPRLIEAIPAVLAWNHWNMHLLRAYGRTYEKRTVSRIAWLADVTLTIDKHFGFPWKCTGRASLARFLRSVKPPGGEGPGAARDLDGLGRPTNEGRLHPIWKRWKISYAADLGTFRDRAERLKTILASRPPG